MVRRLAVIAALLSSVGAVSTVPAALAATETLEAPRNVTAVPLAGSDGRVYLSWTRPVPNDGSSYTVYLDGPGGLTHLQSLGDVYSTHVASLTPGGAGYCFRVKRLRGGDSSGHSAMGCGQAHGTSPLPAPGAVTVTPLATDRLYVSWVRPQPNDGSSYEVHLQVGSRWVRAAAVGDVYAAHAAGLQPNTLYCFNVVRVRDGVRSGWSPAGCGRTMATPPPPPPAAQFPMQVTHTVHTGPHRAFDAHERRTAGTQVRLACWVAGTVNGYRADTVSAPGSAPSNIWHKLHGSEYWVPDAAVATGTDGAPPPGEPACSAIGVSVPAAPAVADRGNYPDWERLHCGAGGVGCGDAGTVSDRGFFFRQCTDYVAWRLNATNPALGFRNLWHGGHFGDGGSWIAAARHVEGELGADSPVRVLSGARAGAVAVGAGSPGHVAFVQSVNPDGTVTVHEYNWTNSGSPWPRLDDGAYGTFAVRTVGAGHFAGYLWFAGVTS